MADDFKTPDRFDTLTKLVAVKEGEVFTVEDIPKRMHKVRLLDRDKADITIQTFVFEPAKRTVHLNFSNAGESATAGKLKTLDLNELWGKK